MEAIIVVKVVVVLHDDDDDDDDIGFITVVSSGQTRRKPR